MEKSETVTSVANRVIDFNSVEEFDTAESGFLAKKQFLLHWLLS
ncbi:hypothetical protein [Leuconostoc citreum]|nr:hypothetical protein [Leuconostoc citreum]